MSLYGVELGAVVKVAHINILAVDVDDSMHSVNRHCCEILFFDRGVSAQCASVLVLCALVNDTGSRIGCTKHCNAYVAGNHRHQSPGSLCT